MRLPIYKGFEALPWHYPKHRFMHLAGAIGLTKCTKIVGLGFLLLINKITKRGNPALRTLGIPGCTDIATM